MPNHSDQNPIHSPKRQRLTRREGISIVIAMLMVMAFMLTMADLMQAMNRSKIITESGWNADQARANAEMGLSLGIMSQTKPESYQKAINSWITKRGATLAEDQNVRTLTFASGDWQGNTIQWKVVDAIGGKGQACNKTDSNVACGEKDFDQYFVYPFPGSGTVGGGRCDAALTSTVKDALWYRDMYWYMFGSEYGGMDILQGLKSAMPPSGNEGDKPSGDAASIEGENLYTLNQATKNLTALDHPCMWNTLGKGVSAEIPLYRKVIDASNKVATIGMDKIDNFWLRVRLPCKQGTVCRSDQRYKITANVATLKDEMKVSDNNVNYYNLLHWNVQGKCKVKDDNNNSKDNLCYISDVNANALAAIIPATPNGPTEGKDLAEAIGDMGPPILKNMTFNKNDSAITYQRLANASSDFSKAFDLTDTVLSFVTKTNKPLYIRDGNSEINYGKFKDFFGKKTPWNFIKEITNPLFRLSIASSLITTANGTDGKPIKTDHIEYQLLYKRTNSSDTTPIITNPVVTATGSSNGYDITLEKSVLKQGGAYNYPIIGK